MTRTLLGWSWLVAVYLPFWVKNHSMGHKNDKDWVTAHWVLWPRAWNAGAPSDLMTALSSTPETIDFWCSPTFLINLCRFSCFLDLFLLGFSFFPFVFITSTAIIGSCDRYCPSVYGNAHRELKQTGNLSQKVINLESRASRRVSVDGCESVNNSQVSRSLRLVWLEKRVTFRLFWVRAP